MFEADEADAAPDDVPPEVAREIVRIKSHGWPYAVPSIEELTPMKTIYGTKSGEMLDPKKVAEGRRKELTTLVGQDALWVIPRSAIPPTAKIVRSMFVKTTSTMS